MKQLYIIKAYMGKFINRSKEACRMAGAIILAVVMSFSLIACSSGKSSSNITKGGDILPIASKAVDSGEAAANPDEISITGVLTYIDGTSQKMHYMDVQSGNEYEVSYSGGTDIKSKYDSVITTARLSLGTIYDVTCNRDGWAKSIHESDKAWKISQITGFSADERERTATISSKTYKYARSAVVMSGSERIQLSEIMKQDAVTVCGIDSTVYSVSVDKGHGYLKLTGVDDFLGGYVDIGTQMVCVVEKDMLLTVPEGEYKVQIQNTNRSMSASKTVKIEKDTDVTLDFSEYRTQATQNGLVEFSVTPAGAVMYIDGTQVSYEQPISLEYGKHTVVLRSNNYMAYEEVFYVTQSYEKKIIDMTISKSSQSGQTATKSSQTSAGSNNRSTAASGKSGQTGTTSGKSPTTASTSGNAIVNGTVKDLTEGYYVSIKGPQGAAVYVNNYYVGIAPVTVDKKAGTMVMTFTMVGKQTKSYSVEIANSTGDVSYEFPALPDSQPVSSVAVD